MAGEGLVPAGVMLTVLAPEVSQALVIQPELGVLRHSLFQLGCSDTSSGASDGAPIPSRSACTQQLLIHADLAAGDITAAQAESMGGWFVEAARHWRTAAAWPPHVRLAGHTPTLRQLGRDVRDACGADPSLRDFRAPMTTAARLSLLHASVMDELATRRQLWIHTARTDYRGDHIEAWSREPSGAAESWPLVQATRYGHQALDRAVSELARTVRSEAPLSEGWPPERTIEGAGLRQDATPHRLSQRPHLEVGR